MGTVETHLEERSQNLRLGSLNLSPSSPQDPFLHGRQHGNAQILWVASAALKKQSSDILGDTVYIRLVLGKRQQQK